MSKSMQQYILNQEVQWIYSEWRLSFFHCILWDIKKIFKITKTPNII